MTNSPRLEQLIHDGKLSLSLQDAIALALENSMDIVVTRYNPWMADVSLLKTRAGGYSYGTPGSISYGSTANLPSLLYDPLITQTIQVADVTTPINNPFTSGIGTTTSGVFGLVSHSAIYNTQYQQNFVTGTSFTAAWDNTRSSSNADNFFNPYVQSSLAVTISQPLLAGAGRFVNRRNIIIAENNRKIADLVFTQQAITTTTNTITAYWELAYAREYVNVTQQAVTVAEKLYSDNKKQLDIGTMAPLDVTRAESELATDRQNLIVAQTIQLQDELVLKNYISKDPLASNLISVEIIPTDKPDSPASIVTASFDDAVKEAFAKRPDLQEQYYNLKNADVDVRATKNALLPTATLSAYYASAGLAGNSFTTGPASVIAGQQIVNGSGVAVPGLYIPETVASVTGVAKDGLSTAQSQIFHNDFPTYAAQLTLTLPLRNRAAQADNVHAQLVKRQMEAQTQQIKNTALLDVRNTTIAVEQGRAQVQAASKARELQQQTFDAERKKYELGASTVYQRHSHPARPHHRSGHRTARLGQPRRSQSQLRARPRPHPRSQQRHHRRRPKRRHRARHLDPRHSQRPGRRHRSTLQVPRPIQRPRPALTRARTSPLRRGPARWTPSRQVVNAVVIPAALPAPPFASRLAWPCHSDLSGPTFSFAPNSGASGRVVEESLLCCSLLLSSLRTLRSLSPLRNPSLAS